MNPSISVGIDQYPLRVRWFMAVAWALIFTKCWAVWWVIDHWRVPVHPLWIIGPTLAFAVLASIIWLTHRPE